MNDKAFFDTNVLGMTRDEIAEGLAAIRVRCPSPMPLTIETHEAGLRIAAQYQFHIYDGSVAASALDAECTTRGYPFSPTAVSACCAVPQHAYACPSFSAGKPQPVSFFSRSMSLRTTSMCLNACVTVR